MLVANFTSRIPTMGQTKTWQDWTEYMGAKPNRLGVVARHYTDNTLNFITDGLKNVYLKDNKPSGFKLSNSLLIEWEVNFGPLLQEYNIELSKIGKFCDENTEVISRITKGLETPQSVGLE